MINKQIKAKRENQRPFLVTWRVTPISYTCGQRKPRPRPSSWEQQKIDFHLGPIWVLPDRERQVPWYMGQEHLSWCTLNFWILKFPETIQVCKSDYWHCPPASILSKDEAESSFLHGLCAPLSICLPSWPGATTRVKSQPSGDVLCLRMAETERRQSPAYHQTIFFFFDFTMM